MADTTDLKSVEEIRTGSNPVMGTNPIIYKNLFKRSKYYEKIRSKTGSSKE